MTTEDYWRWGMSEPMDNADALKLYSELLADATARIAKLEKALREIADDPWTEDSACHIAMAALEDKS